jgi:ABC-type phosphate transport system substrate-binding protein
MMKTWQICLVIVLIVCLPLLSACGLFGKSKAEKEREYQELQIEAYNQQVEIYNQQQEEYRQALQEALQEWAEEAYGSK